MAIGDDAAAAGMDLVSGSSPANTLDTEDNKSRDYIAQFGVKPGTALSIARGGTGATTPAAAADALQVVPTSDVVISDGTQTVAGKIPRYTAAGRMIVGAPAGATDIANKSYVDNAVAGVGGGVADKVTSAAYSRQAGADRYAMWMDGARNIGRSTSTRRHKRDIRPALLDVEAFLGVPVVTFVRDVDEETGTRDLGLIAEDLADAGLTDLVWDDDDGRPAGIHEHRLVYYLIAAVQELRARVDELERERR